MAYLAELPAKFYSAGFRRIPQEWPDSGRNHRGRVKTSVAINKATSIVGDVDWVLGVKKPSQTEIITVYGGKSTFYKQAKVLQYISNYSDMVEWLERTDFDVDETTEF